MITANNISSPDPGADLRRWRRILWRRKGIIAASALVALICAIALDAMTPIRYQAEAVVAPNIRKVEISPLDDVVSGLPRDAPALRTEIDIMSSRSAAEKVIDALGLTTLGPESKQYHARPWVPQSSPNSWSSREFLSFLSGEDTATDEVQPDPSRESLIDELLSGLRVSNDGRSYTIYIAFVAGDALVAARIANAYAEAYLDQQVEFQQAGTRRAVEWLGSKLVDLRAQLERSEIAVEQLRRDSGLIKSNGVLPQALRISTLNSELALARSNRAAAEARLATATRLAKSPRGLESFSETLNSPLINAIRQQAAELGRELTRVRELGALSGSQTPVLIAQQADLQEQIDAEVGRLLTSLGNEVEIANLKEHELEVAIRDTEAELAQSNEAMIYLNQLEREASANRAIYESFLSRYKQIVEQEGLAVPEARLISRAEPSDTPLAPKPATFRAGSARWHRRRDLPCRVREALDTRIRSSDVLEHTSEIPVVGEIPRVRLAAWRAPSDLPISRPNSRYSDAVRKLSTTLRLQRGEAKVIMITSANPREGKTTLAVSLARTLALSGQKVVVVDTNVDRPSVGEYFGAPPIGNPHQRDLDGSPGSPAPELDRRSNARFISRTRLDRHVEMLPGSNGFGAFIARLRREHDVVILDTSALLKSADVATIGDLADLTLLAVRWESTLRRDVAAALRYSVSAGSQSAASSETSSALARFPMMLSAKCIATGVRIATEQPAGGTFLPELLRDPKKGTAARSAIRRRRPRNHLAASTRNGRKMLQTIQAALFMAGKPAARLFAALAIAACALMPMDGNSCAAEKSGYPIGPGDLLQIVVYGDENVARTLSGQFRVGPDGAISYPVLGNVFVGGLATVEIGETLRAALAEQIPISGVPTVSVAEYAPVFVVGGVEKPGPYQFQPDMIVLHLIALAGGLVSRRRSRAGCFNSSLRSRRSQISSSFNSRWQCRGPGCRLRLMTRTSTAVLCRANRLAKTAGPSPTKSRYLRHTGARANPSAIPTSHKARALLRRSPRSNRRLHCTTRRSACSSRN